MELVNHNSSNIDFPPQERPPLSLLSDSRIMHTHRISSHTSRNRFRSLDRVFMQQISSITSGRAPLFISASSVLALVQPHFPLLSGAVHPPTQRREVSLHERITQPDYHSLEVVSHP